MSDMSDNKNNKRKEREELPTEEWVLVIAKNSEWKNSGVYATKRSNLTNEQLEALLSGEKRSIRAEIDLENLDISTWSERENIWKCLADDEDDNELHEFTHPKHRRLCQIFYVWSE